MNGLTENTGKVIAVIKAKRGLISSVILIALIVIAVLAREHLSRGISPKR